MLLLLSEYNNSCSVEQLVVPRVVYKLSCLALDRPQIMIAVVVVMSPCQKIRTACGHVHLTNVSHFPS